MSQVYDKLSSNAGSSWQHMCCAYERLSAKGAMLGRHASSGVPIRLVPADVCGG